MKTNFLLVIAIAVISQVHGKRHRECSAGAAGGMQHQSTTEAAAIASSTGAQADVATSTQPQADEATSASQPQETSASAQAASIAPSQTYEQTSAQQTSAESSRY